MSPSGIERLLIGSSVAMRQLRALILKLAATTMPVLIEGETGSGKELVARALHEASGRTGAFVPVNVCAVSESMFEASLFGHAKGAFTGAVQSSPGFLKEADRGTLLLDEVSGMSVTNQLKLLRAVEHKEFRPVGARADDRSDFRLIAASNERLRDLVETGRFRPDLMHRFGGLHIAVPPLRDRLDDIPALAAYFARAMGVRVSDEAPWIEVDALEMLQSHRWPGNVRELRHVVEGAVITSEGGVVRGRDVKARLAQHSPATSAAASHTRRRRWEEEERELLQHLEHTQWDIDETALRLGVHRTTVYRRIRKLRESPISAQSRDSRAE